MYLYLLTVAVPNTYIKNLTLKLNSTLGTFNGIWPSRTPVLIIRYVVIIRTACQNNHCTWFEPGTVCDLSFQMKILMEALALFHGVWLKWMHQSKKADLSSSPLKPGFISYCCSFGFFSWSCQIGSGIRTGNLRLQTYWNFGFCALKSQRPFF